MVPTNGLGSDVFLVGHRTKQGDPLSPLLFITALEPLAEAIRLNNAIKGIENTKYPFLQMIFKF